MINGAKILELSQKGAIRSFRRASLNVPFYKRYLLNTNVDPANVRLGADFKRLVPVLDKEKLFTANLKDIKEIFFGHDITGCRSILPNSGFSGKFSFGINTITGSKDQEKNIDLMLHRMFDVTRKKTLLVNSLCMGINIPTRKAVTINTGPREDIVISVIKIFAKEFDQIIMVGDNCFIKNVLEGGREQGIEWSSINVHIVLGGDTFPENFRIYLERILGIGPGSKKEWLIGSSLGAAELGLNILWETPKTIRLRKKADKDKNLMKELLGEELPFCPMFFHYNPMSTYLEEENGNLIFTTLSRNTLLPIIRYATGDTGLIIPHDRLATILKSSKLSDCIPQYQIPLVAVKGRSQYIDFGGLRVSPDLIKNILYSDLDLPAKTTGYFRVSKSGDCLIIEIQLKDGVQVTDELKDRFTNLIKKTMGENIKLTLYSYNQFYHGLELAYERKFPYICQCAS